MDDNLLESASEQPFQAGYGVEFYPTIYDKAACLFFSIAGGHIFGNGNKRTAVLALDQFLTANEIYLLLKNEEIRTLAELTASYRERGESVAFARARVLREITQHSIEFRAIRPVNPKMHWTVHRMKRSLRSSLARPIFSKRTPRNPN